MSNCRILIKKGRKNVTKRYLKIAFIGICVLALFAALAFLVYSDMGNKPRKSEAVFSHIEHPALAEFTFGAHPALPAAEFYLARFDGESLGIYSCKDGEEHFLYTLDVRIEDISETELTSLSQGIVLSDKQALAIFEEDFTS